MWEDYKAVVSVCREKIIKSKAQLEINLTSSVKENKKIFNKYMRKKRKIQDNLCPLLYSRINRVVKKGEKDEILNTFFASACRRKTSCLLDTHPTELEDRDGKQNVQEEKVSDLLYHLQAHKSVKLDSFYLRVVRELAEPTFNHLPAALTNWGVSRCLDIVKYDAHLQE